MKIAIIGAGNLGLSIAKGILHSNGATTMYLTKRHPDSNKSTDTHIRGFAHSWNDCFQPRQCNPQLIINFGTHVETIFPV